jgi:hypothetical protein
LWRQILRFGHGQTLAHSPLNTHQPNAKLVLNQFPHGSNPPIAQVVDIIRTATTIFQFHQRADYIDDIVLT